MDEVSISIWRKEEKVLVVHKERREVKKRCLYYCHAQAARAPIYLLVYFVELKTCESCI